MQPTELTYLESKWGVGLEAARCTLEFTTQRGLRTVLRLSLSHRFLTNEQQLRYRRLQHDVFGDTLLAVTKSKRGDKYAEVFVTKFGWSHAFPMANKGDGHEDISLLFQRDRVTPKIIVEG